MNNLKLRPLKGFFEASVAFFYGPKVRVPALTRFLVKATNKEAARKLLEKYFRDREGEWQIREIQTVQVLRRS